MFFDRFWGMLSNDLAIDLGTANTLIIHNADIANQYFQQFQSG